MLIDSENTQVSVLGKPTSFNGETWFTLASFLAYGGNAWVARAANTGGNTYSYSGAGLVLGNTVISIANTTGLAQGQILFYSSNSALVAAQANAVTIVSVNSSSVTLSAAPTGNATANLVFRDPTVYSALAQETVDYTIAWDDQVVKNPTDYLIKDGSFNASVRYIARYPGAMGNSLRVSVCDTPSQFASNTNLQPNSQINAVATKIVANVGSNTITVTVAPADTANATNVTAANTVIQAALASISTNDLIQTGNSSIGYQFMTVANVSVIQNTSNVYSFTISTTGSYNLSQNSSSNTLNRYWEFYNYLQVPPTQSTYQLAHGNSAANDELHVVVVDQNGLFSGVPGSILETFKAVSRATDAKNNNNTTNYYKNVINQTSQYIWWASDRSTALSTTAALLSSSTGAAPMNIQFIGGDDGHNENDISLGSIANAYNLFSSAVDVDISLVMTGKAKGLPVNSNTQLATYLINNIAEKRKDCVVFHSPDIGLVVNNKGYEAVSVVAARNTMPSSSYSFMDSGYKYMYDRYNDVYRWVPLNGDMAGLCAQTDMTNAQWWSPAGYNRGNVKNVVRLAWNPKEPERDILYPAGVNPVVTEKGAGTILLGDKTTLAKPSAFDRINVRRLFIVLEKSIATASKFTLFEFNDEFTRAQFKAMITPFLRDIQARRGITGFYIRCDSTNNTAQVIQNNQFIADIFIRPNYSINWVRLNFVAVPPSLSFAEAEQTQF